MREDANKIALRVARAVLDGARPLELDVAGVRVNCEVARAEKAWPSYHVKGLDRETDGPWPADVKLRCSWEGGGCTLEVAADYWHTNGPYRHDVALRVDVIGSGQGLVWTTLPPWDREPRRRRESIGRRLGLAGETQVRQHQ